MVLHYSLMAVVTCVATVGSENWSNLYLLSITYYTCCPIVDSVITDVPFLQGMETHKAVFNSSTSEFCRCLNLQQFAAFLQYRIYQASTV